MFFLYCSKIALCCVIVLRCSVTWFDNDSIQLSIARHILSSANIKLGLHAIIYTRLGRKRERKLRSTIKFETQIRLIASKLSSFSMKTIRFFLCRFLCKDSIANNNRSFGSLYDFLDFSGRPRGCVLSSRGRKICSSRYTYLLPYTSSTRWRKANTVFFFLQRII